MAQAGAHRLADAPLHLLATGAPARPNVAQWKLKTVDAAVTGSFPHHCRLCLQADERCGVDRGRSDGGANPGNNLHVSGLSGSVEERDLEDAFSKYGRVSTSYLAALFAAAQPAGSTGSKSSSHARPSLQGTSWLCFRHHGHG